MYETIVVPTDGSSQSDAAVDHAVELARHHGSEIHVVYVADSNRDSLTTQGGEVVDALEQEGEQVVSEAVDRADAGTDISGDVLTGDPVETILDYAHSVGSGLIVMGTAGRRGLDRFLLGSTTERVVRLSSVPVLTVRAQEE
ncbi:universal stress protein UspA [Halobellus salinus]|uniref:Universal stress protein UspA n=1 Tax=Halobellus salinus TaxID=931585 RepID=A0A830E856_9EURY|nr:universal stress protein [Halobellus salinus]GGI99433.1 universal stress protein UspA [Halobellus salinus]SMP04703.1 Nucleotide-binding universal stress protein, UspA family [Halobellus salinus]